jgi:hypothetical protein
MKKGPSPRACATSVRAVPALRPSDFRMKSVPSVSPLPRRAAVSLVPAATCVKPSAKLLLGPTLMFLRRCVPDSVSSEIQGSYPRSPSVARKSACPVLRSRVE